MEILLILLLLWRLSGYLPGRPIRRKKNRWHARGTFDQVHGFIDGDKKSYLPEPMAYPEQKVFFLLIYPEFVEDGRKEAHTKKSSEGKDIICSEAIEILGIEKPIRVVTEEVTRIRKKESHPYIVTVTIPKVGIFYFVFTLTMNVHNPMKMLEMDQFLLFIGRQLNDAVYPWGVKLQEKISLKYSHLNEAEAGIRIVDEIIGLNIDTDDSIMLNIKNKTINLKDYINEEAEPYGTDVADLSLSVGYDGNIKKILDKRNAQVVQTQETLLQTEVDKTRDVTRKIELKDNEQEISLDKKHLLEVGIPAVQAEAKAQKEVAAAWKVNTLMLGNDGKYAITIPERPNKKRGGQNVAA